MSSASIPTSLPSGVFLLISMFLVSMAFRELNRGEEQSADRARIIEGINKFMKFALVHVVVGTLVNLTLTWLTLGPTEPTPPGRARVTAYLLASGLNALFPSLLGLGGVYYVRRRAKKD